MVCYLCASADVLDRRDLVKRCGISPLFQDLGRALQRWSAPDLPVRVLVISIPSFNLTLFCSAILSDMLVAPLIQTFPCLQFRFSWEHPSRDRGIAFTTLAMIFPPMYAPHFIQVCPKLTSRNRSGLMSAFFGPSNWRGPSWLFIIAVRGLATLPLPHTVGSDAGDADQRDHVHRDVHLAGNTPASLLSSMLIPTGC